MMSGLNDRWWSEADEDPIHLAAADWYLRLQETELSNEEMSAWQNWIREDSRHAKAFARIAEVAEAVDQLDAPRSPGQRQLSRDTYDGSVPLRTWTVPTRYRPGVLLAAAVVLTVGGIFLAAFDWAGARSAQHFSTSVGENRTIHLQDGSTVTLGGDTRIEVKLSDTERHIELEHGEAYFDVAKDPTRSFKVLTGDATVMAVGTAFNVRQNVDRVVVSVLEGKIIVEPRSRLRPVALMSDFKPKLAPILVDSGQQAIVRASGVDGATAVENLEAATAWRTGHLAFRGQPLRYVLADVNRYASKPIVLDDETLGTLEYTGTVARDNVRGWIMSLERAFNIVAVEEGDRVVIRPK